jgi:curved DNA-binding protein CbpA
MKDYYKILNVANTADEKQIKKAYHKLALKYHPDKNPNEVVKYTKIFEELSEAYSVLSDPIKRKEYEQSKLMNQFRNSEENFQGFARKQNIFKYGHPNSRRFNYQSFHYHQSFNSDKFNKFRYNSEPRNERNENEYRKENVNSKFHFLNFLVYAVIFEIQSLLILQIMVPNRSILEHFVSTLRGLLIIWFLCSRN